MNAPLSARPLNTWDIAKVAAIILMFIDHSGSYFLCDDIWLRAIGRGAAPIFLFLAGFASSYRFNWEIFILAVLLWLANLMVGYPFYMLGILFNILICRGILNWLELKHFKIRRPYEWFISALVFIPTTCMVLMYGSIGFMFAMSGFLKRHHESFSPNVALNFLRATFVVFAAWETVIFKFSYIEILIMMPVLYGVYRLLSTLEIQPVNLSHYPAWVTALCKFISYYSARIYALHLLVIWALTGQHI